MRISATTGGIITAKDAKIDFNYKTRNKQYLLKKICAYTTAKQAVEKDGHKRLAKDYDKKIDALTNELKALKQ